MTDELKIAVKRVKDQCRQIVESGRVSPRPARTVLKAIEIFEKLDSLDLGSFASEYLWELVKSWNENR